MGGFSDRAVVLQTVDDEPGVQRAPATVAPPSSIDTPATAAEANDLGKGEWEAVNVGKESTAFPPPDECSSIVMEVPTSRVQMESKAGPPSTSKVEKDATSILFGLSEAQTAVDRAHVLAQKKVFVAKRRQRRKKESQMQLSQEPVKAYLPPLRHSPTVTDSVPPAASGRERTMQLIGRTPAPMKRALLTQLSIREREAMTADEEYWSRRQRRSFNLSNRLYKMPQPKGPPDVEDCIVQHMPKEAVAGVVPQAFMDLLAFARNGVISESVLAKTGVVNTVPGYNVGGHAAQVLQHKELIGEVLSKGEKGHSEPDTRSEEHYEPKPIDPDLEELSVVELIGRAREKESTAGTTKKKKREDDRPFNMCLKRKGYYNGGVVSVGKGLTIEPPSERLKYRVPQYLNTSTRLLHQPFTLPTELGTPND